jgi:Fe-S cluster assembly protein SufD
MSFLQAIESMLATDTGSQPGAELRANHARRFLQSGVPGPKQENWKYTPLRLLDALDYGQTPTGVSALAPEDLPELGLDDLAGWRLVLVNGRVSENLSFLDGLPEGVSLRPLNAQTELPDWASNALAAPFEAPDESLSALNGALTTGGWVLEVSPGVVLEQPLQLVHLGLPADGAVIGHSRMLIRLGDNARGRLVERYLGPPATANVDNDVVQIQLEEAAELEHVRIQEASPDSFLVTRILVDQQQDSSFRYCGVDLGGRLVRHDLVVRLTASGATCQLNGVYVLDGQSHVDNHIRIDHLATDTTSEELFKGVLDGKSRAVFNGKVVVHPGANGTDATQTNSNLLLSRQAEVDTKPELEIYADDVSCSHGATVGELDAAQLFYLRSRGIPEHQARLMLTDAFCREVVDRLGDEALQSMVSERIGQRLPQLDILEVSA